MRPTAGFRLQVDREVTDIRSGVDEPQYAVMGRLAGDSL